MLIACVRHRVRPGITLVWRKNVKYKKTNDHHHEQTENREQDRKVWGSTLRDVVRDKRESLLFFFLVFFSHNFDENSRRPSEKNFIRRADLKICEWKKN